MLSRGRKLLITPSQADIIFQICSRLVLQELDASLSILWSRVLQMTAACQDHKQTLRT